MKWKGYHCIIIGTYVELSRFTVYIVLFIRIWLHNKIYDQFFKLKSSVQFKIMKQNLREIKNKSYENKMHIRMFVGSVFSGFIFLVFLNHRYCWNSTIIQCYLPHNLGTLHTRWWNPHILPVQKYCFLRYLWLKKSPFEYWK